MPDKPWYVFNNSFVLRNPVVGGGSENGPNACEPVGPDFTAHLTFANNALEWCSPDPHGDRVCEWIDLLHDFATADDGVLFDHSLTNRADYLDQARSKAVGEKAELFADAPLFADPDAALFAEPATRKFRLRAGSAGLGSGAPLRLAMPDGSSRGIRRNADGTLNRGAVQDDGLVELDDPAVA